MTDLYQIESDALIVEISSLGAELKRIYSKTAGKELLWKGDSTVWGRSAPILFPFVGKLTDNEYVYQSKTYAMTQHGFARDTEFKCLNKKSQEIEFLMPATQKTFAAYPFCFELILRYKLEGNTLTISHFVKNDDRQDILFSIGAHPGFNTDQISDYEIAFESVEQGYFRLDEGKVNWDKPNFLKDKVISLSPELFVQDALIFKGLKSEYVDLRNKKNGAIIRVHSDAPYWGIWGKGEVPFVCIEPWYGVADVTGHNKELNHKEGILRLEQGKVFEFSYSIEYLT
jgi:galactose mutarotase-like enzyme